VDARRPRRRFVLASGNAGKRREIEAILADDEILSLSAFAGIVLPEEGDDYVENACVKARTVAQATGLASLADDSGLEVDALGGRPGVHSARYGGPGLDDRGRVECLLRELASLPDPLTARFVCLAACVLPDGRTWTARGVCEGRIVRTARGAQGFGYDPIFVPAGFSRTCAELDPEEKDRISHRGLAFRALAGLLAREADAGFRGAAD
jgi:XTP/dITP diphosphohydrolase